MGSGALRVDGFFGVRVLTGFGESCALVVFDLLVAATLEVENLLLGLLFFRFLGVVLVVF